MKSLLVFRQWAVPISNGYYPDVELQGFLLLISPVAPSD